METRCFDRKLPPAAPTNLESIRRELLCGNAFCIRQGSLIKSNSMKRGVLVALLLAWSSAGPPLYGADAVFSNGGGSVFLTGGGSEARIVEVGLKTGERTEIALEGASGRINGVAVSNSGNVLCVAEKGLWAYDPEKRKTVKVCDAPSGTTFRDVAYDPSGRSVLLTGVAKDGGEVWLRKAGAKDPVRVFCRRVRFVEGPVFDRRGNLLFCTEGDVWIGRIILEDDPDSPPTLAAYRYAPVATRETNLGTPSQTGARALAVTDRYIYAHVARMGGSGWGDVVRLKNPISAGASGDIFPMYEGLEDRLRLYREALSFVQILGENGGLAYLGQSNDGKTACYFTRDDTGLRCWIAVDDEEPRELKMGN